MPELIVLLVIILIIFGAGKLPEIGAGLGKAIRGFKRGVSEEDETEGAPKEIHGKEQSGQGQKH